MMPKISVVMPSFNQAAFIEKSLQSVIGQNYPNLDLIVIDGGSTDGSVEIIKKYAANLSYWVSEPDGGQTHGLIKGFKRSTGEIQCWLNSDDLMADGSLFQVAAFFSNHSEAEAVFGNATWIDRDGRRLREQREIGFNRFLWFHTYNYIPGMSMYWRRSLYERVGGLNAAFNLAMDADLWARFSEVTQIYHVRKNWSFMRFYPEQKNRRLRERSDAEDQLIRERHWGSKRPKFLRTKQKAATLIRIALKFTSGCYSVGYQRRIKDGNH